MRSNIAVALTFASLLAGGSLHAQYIPTIIPPSPVASALMKFVDVPVSPYTGTTDITIPIYTIQAKGVAVPVSLDYHTGGIRLKEESGLVGLGWALNAGGSVSRTIVDKDDFGSGGTYFTTNVPQLAGDLSTAQPPQTKGQVNLSNYLFDFFCNDQVNFSTGTADYNNAFATMYQEPYDMEPDIFSYNFAGHSGKFILTRSRQVILQKQDNIKIQFDNLGNSFTITDDQGNIFYFADKAYVNSASLGASPPSSWNLSKVITAQKDSVVFTYSTSSTAEYVGPDYNHVQTYYSGTSQDGFQILNGAGTFYGSELLQTIDFSTGRLQFYYDNNRSDLQGGKKLDTVKLFSKLTSGLQYQKEFDFSYSYFNNSIVASDSLEMKRLRLDSVREAAGAYSFPAYSFIYNLPATANAGPVAKHGYSLDHWGYFNGMPNTGFIPSLSLYYAPPTSQLHTTGPTYIVYNGADRSAYGAYMPAFSLAQVTYPTGGKTVLEYESNDYDAVKSKNGPVDFPQVQRVTNQVLISSAKRGDTSGTINLAAIYPTVLSASMQTNLTILLTFRASDNNGLQHWDTGPYGKIQFGFSGPDVNLSQDITGSAMTCGGTVCTINIPVSIHFGGSTIFTWSAHIDPSVGADFQDIRATFQFDSIQQAGSPVGPGTNNYAVPSGGLRIKSITDYSDPNTVSKKRRFEYNYTTTVGGVVSNYSYGKLLSPLCYARYSLVPGSGGSVYASLVITGSSNIPLSNTATGNIVGYDQVTEYTIDPVTNVDIGKIVYTYFNSPDSLIDYHGYRFPGVTNMGNNLNSLLLSKTEYANAHGSYTIVSSTNNTYHTTNRIVYNSPKYFFTGQTGTNYNGICLLGTGVTEVLACFYPSLKSERVLLDSTTEIAYDQSDPTKYLVSGKRNFYDNPVHYQLTRSRVNDSKGNTLVTKLTYPQDYIPNGSAVTNNSWLDTMISHNMVSEVIEKSDSLYYPGSASGFVNGGQLSTYKILPSNVAALDKQYQLDVGSPVSDFQGFSINGNAASQDSRYRQMISFDGYDNGNSISQYTPIDQTPVSILWNYNHTYPVAQVKKAAVTDIAYTSFEADDNGGWNIGNGTVDYTSSITGAASYVLNGVISRANLNSATTYVVSYWTQNKTPYTIAGTVNGYPAQGKSISMNGTNWTYFEHLVTGQPTIAVNVSGHIDELRLYPAGALMTTYTYSPLTGITDQCDMDNRVSYYTYDGFGRLRYIKDQDGNILKTIEYHYQGQ